MRASWLCVLVMVGGCLTTPVPRSRDDLSVSDQDMALDMSGDDGGSCSFGGGVGAGQAFPPDTDGGMTVALRFAETVDLNCDGRDDLLLSNATEDDASEGVFILLGRTAGFATRYDARINTAGVAPYGISMQDVFGSPHKELLIHGKSGQNAYALIYEATGSSSFAATPLQRLTQVNTLADIVNPWGITVGNRNGPRGAYFIATHIYDALVTEVSGFSQSMLDAPPLQQLPVECPVGNRLVFRPFSLPAATAGAPEDIWLVGGSCAMRFVNDTGNFLNNPVKTQLPSSMLHYIKPWDFNGDGRIEVIGMGANSLSAVELPPSGPAREFPWAGGTLNFIDGAGQSLEIANLDADPRPELIIFDQEAGDPSELRVYENLSLSGTALTAPSLVPIVHQVTDASRFAAVGDFDGDGRRDLCLFQAGGASNCLHLCTNMAAHTLKKDCP